MRSRGAEEQRREMHRREKREFFSFLFPISSFLLISPAPLLDWRLPYT
jgi:hypothetical protein